MHFYHQQGQVKEFVRKPTFKRPSELTWGDVTTAGVVTVQLAGSFMIGESIARERINGYDSHN